MGSIDLMSEDLHDRLAAIPRGSVAAAVPVYREYLSEYGLDADGHSRVPSDIVAEFLAKYDDPTNFLKAAQILVAEYAAKQ